MTGMLLCLTELGRLIELGENRRGKDTFINVHPRKNLINYLNCHYLSDTHTRVLKH